MGVGKTHALEKGEIGEGWKSAEDIILLSTERSLFRNQKY